MRSRQNEFIAFVFGPRPYQARFGMHEIVLSINPRSFFVGGRAPGLEESWRLGREKRRLSLFEEEANVEILSTSISCSSASVDS
jgi:hypothetical protein